MGDVVIAPSFFFRPAADATPRHFFFFGQAEDPPEAEDVTDMENIGDTSLEAAAEAAGATCFTSTQALSLLVQK